MHTIAPRILFLLGILAFTTFGSVADSIVCRYLGSIGGSYSAHAVLTKPDGKTWLFTGIGNTIAVFDITDGGNPTVSAKIFIGERCSEIIIAGNVAYIAAMAAGLVILDVSVPLIPAIAATLPVSDMQVRDICIRGKYLYAATMNGIEIYDISAKTSAIRLGNIREFNNPSMVALLGDCAYVLTQDGIEVIDVEDPEKPVRIRLVNIGTDIKRTIFISGTTAMVFSRDTGRVTTLDLSDPRNPVMRMVAPQPLATAFMVYDSTVCYIDTSRQLYRITASDPVEAQPVATLPTGWKPGVFSMYGSRAIVANARNLAIIDISDQAHPSVVGTRDELGSITYDIPERSLLCVTENDTSLAIVDITDINNPQKRGVIPIRTSSLRQMASSFNRLYFTTSDSMLYGYDISSTGTPRLLGRYRADAPTSSLSVIDSFIMLGLTTLDLRIMDSELLSEGRVFSIVKFSLQPQAAYRRNGNLIVVCRGGDPFGGNFELNVLSIIDPARPLILGSCSGPGYPGLLQFTERHGYLTTGLIGWLSLLDLSSPSKPELDTSIFLPFSSSQVPINDNLVVISDTGGIKVLDLSNPGAPRQRMAHPFRFRPYITRVNDSTFHLRNGTGMEVVQLTSYDPTATAEKSAAPPSTTIAPDKIQMPLRIRSYDLLGRCSLRDTRSTDREYHSAGILIFADLQNRHTKKINFKRGGP